MASSRNHSTGESNNAHGHSMTSTSPWNHRHLLALEQLTRDEITYVLDQAETYSAHAQAGRMKHSILNGTLVAQLFFENSTRTRSSFGLAARRLGADTLDFSPSSSSISKGESFIDTAQNLVAMGARILVVRHSVPGTPQLLTQYTGASVVNAGDGAHEHPTQALLDLLTIRQRKGRIEGLTVALVGDILHSRVARSNIWALRKLGARVILCGPPTLVSDRWSTLGCEVHHHLDEILPEVDVINVLRIQFERQRSALFPSVSEYFDLYGMTQKRVEMGRPDLLLLAPGPINRGVELTPEVADGPNSAILDQVTNGLAVRMAVLGLVVGQPAPPL
jgi:aspartate carbamoyltransferase catalytic subunit